ncbi:tripartite tricarboxylate transporter TctB family protein [Pelistega sp. MC2]|uniref:tripartite tricarboxylate transporter TctB family protein n=1 Tax=Pelistega sp. MC2 TaxID=1720297 RepID=UPI00210AE00A|nr:tripartite tricarboxylate transporter TctB family protein [Pelistega sp. MC2]
MQNKSAENSQAKPWWLAVAVLIIGAVCIYNATDLSATAQYAAVGPGLFLLLTGLGLLLCGLILLIQIAKGEKFEPQDEEDASGNAPMDKKAFFLSTAATIVPVLIIETIGLPITAMIAFTMVAYAFGSKKTLIDMILGFLVGTVSWFIFSYLGLQLGSFLPLLNS